MSEPDGERDRTAPTEPEDPEGTRAAGADTPEQGGERSPAAPDVDAALEGLDPEQLEGLEFTIEADGSVTFIDFPPEMLEIAMALNPDDPLVCERRDALEGGGGDAEADDGA